MSYPVSTQLEATPWNEAETRRQPFAEREVTILRPPSGWQLLNIQELWRFRELLFFLAWRDVKVRYKQTLLGAAWAILQPLLMMMVFTIIFSRMAEVSSGGFPYPLFVVAGLLPWTFFANALTSAGNSVVGSERLITKIYFPRLAVPFASVGAALVDFAFAFGLMIVLMTYYGMVPGAGILLAPVFFALIVILALGIGTALAALNVAYRDFRYAMPFLIQLWMFGTPTVYMQPAERTPEELLHWLVFLNPMTSLIGSFRASLLGGAMPWSQLGWSAICVGLFFLLGCLYFRKVEDGFADII